MSRTHYDWPGVIERLAATPNVWVMALPNVPARTAKIVRLRQHPALRREDGVVEVSLRNVWHDDRERPRGDLFLRWVPHTVS